MDALLADPHADAATASVRITIPGSPIPWQRARRKRLPDGRVLSFTAKAVEGYHSVIRLAAAGVMDGRPPYDGALEMTVLAVFSVPASWSQKKRGQALAGTIAKVTKPDAENLMKGAADALQGVAYLDDRQIVSLHVRKAYGTQPRLEIELRQI